MKYSFLNDKVNEETNINVNQYMNIWIDFLKILSLQLSSIASSSLLNSNHKKEVLNEKSELYNENIPILLFSEPNNHSTLYYSKLENNIEHHWSIFGQEFINKIKIILHILNMPSTEQYSTVHSNNEKENKNDKYNSHFQNKIQIALTLLTSLFERFLGDVLYTQISNEAKIPFLFKDLIVQTELIQLWQKNIKHLTVNKTNFGNDKNNDDVNDNNCIKTETHDIDPLTLILILLFGGPNYLNIRNLLWHGFVILSPLSSTTTSEITKNDNDDPFPIHHYFQLTWAVFTLVFNRIKTSLEYQYQQKQLNDGSTAFLNRSFSNTTSNSQFIFNFGNYCCLLS
ncbi:hypothetical protein PIROE2DRAFT_9620 [Piromyces sp. E2]|nr:hypothetical protein PIROE2DRAFT_9620 [Piromyces sp. E2]|eukprot:OUM63758.1 hypothetical protein PIROE2DRAFT_9620 [Piromyces sp. E2]